MIALQKLIIIGITILLLLCNVKKIHAISYYWAPKVEIADVKVTTSDGSVTDKTDDQEKNFNFFENEPSFNKSENKIVMEAQKYLGVPYVWGGTSPQGFDCSGLVQYVYARCGKQLPRVTTQQEHCGRKIPLNQAQPGDLYFWGFPGQTYHVALACGNGKFIQAPAPGQNVMVSDIDFFRPNFAIHLE